MRLRIKPGNDCIIQKLDCDGNWQDWFDAACGQADAIANSEYHALHTIGQITEPSPPLSGSGDCVEYDIVMSGNQQYLLPVAVDIGDTIEISNAQGAMADGVGFLFATNWWWPNGHPYRGISGEDFDPSGNFVEGDDPLVTADHMLLIANINGTWYPAFNTTITVPDGVVNARVIFMCNDHEISDNSGTWRFHVKICKVGTGLWTKVFDFTLSDYSSIWQPHVGGVYSGDVRAVYESGLGYGPGTQFPGLVQLESVADFTASRIIHAKVTLDTPLSGVTHDVRVDTNITYGDIHSTVATVFDIDLVDSSDDTVNMFINVQDDDSHTASLWAGHLTRLEVTGIGTMPPEWSE